MAKYNGVFRRTKYVSTLWSINQYSLCLSLNNRSRTTHFALGSVYRYSNKSCCGMFMLRSANRT